MCVVIVVVVVVCVGVRLGEALTFNKDHLVLGQKRIEEVKLSHIGREGKPRRLHRIGWASVSRDMYVCVCVRVCV